jgi:hypothetical protein
MLSCFEKCWLGGAYDVEQGGGVILMDANFKKEIRIIKT